MDKFTKRSWIQFLPQSPGFSHYSAQAETSCPRTSSVSAQFFLSLLEFLF